MGLAAIMLLNAPRLADAQVVQGVEKGAREGNKAAGPVGGVLGGAIGGVVGVVTGVTGVLTGGNNKGRTGTGGKGCQARRGLPSKARLPNKASLPSRVIRRSRRREQGHEDRQAAATAARRPYSGRRAANDGRTDRLQQRRQYRADQEGIKPHARTGEALGRVQQCDALSRS